MSSSESISTASYLMRTRTAVLLWNKGMNQIIDISTFEKDGAFGS